MKVTKYQLQKGQKVRTTWKGKEYVGVIIEDPRKAAQESARITRGRFIYVPILTEGGRIERMPYTSRTTYVIEGR